MGREFADQAGQIVRRIERDQGHVKIWGFNSRSQKEALTIQ